MSLTTTARGYSLWLIPEDKASEEFQSIIWKLSHTYDTPVFKPHITLIGQLENDAATIITKTAQLASEIKTMELEIGSPGSMDSYFRRLFFTIKPDNSLMNANLMARKLFNRGTEPAFFPHLSLMYCLFEKRRMQSIMKDIHLPDNLIFTIKELQVYSTEGSVHEWIFLKRFPLNTS